MFKVIDTIDHTKKRREKAAVISKKLVDFYQKLGMNIKDLVENALITMMDRNHFDEEKIDQALNLFVIDSVIEKMKKVYEINQSAIWDVFFEVCDIAWRKNIAAAKKFLDEKNSDELLRLKEENDHWCHWCQPAVM